MIIDNINTELEFRNNISFLKGKMLSSKNNINNILSTYNDRLFENINSKIIENNKKFLIIKHDLNRNRELSWIKFINDCTMKGSLNEDEKIKILLVKGKYINNINKKMYENYSSLIINSHDDYDLNFLNGSVAFIESKRIKINDLLV